MCDCASCKYTNEYRGDIWPTDNPKGPRKSNAEYAAHVAHMWIGVVRERTQFGSMGADWYGRAKGVSKRETERVLREAFTSTLPDSAFSDLG